MNEASEAAEERIPLRRRIGFRILLAILGIAVSAVVVTGAAQYVLASMVMKENVAQRNLQIARRAAGEISLYVRGSLRDLSAVEQSIVPIRDPWVRDLVLENTVTIHRQFRSISVVSEAGEVLASSALDNTEASFPRELVGEAVLRRGLTLSSVQLSSESLPYMIVALPSRGSGLERTVVVAELMLRDVWDMVDGISFGESGRALLISREGILIAHPDKTKILTSARGGAAARSILAAPSQGGYVVAPGEEGTPVLLAFWPVDDAPWFVAVEQAVRDAWVPVGAMLTNAGVTMIGFVFVAALVSVLLARGFSTPLAMLLSGTERIRAGDLSHRIRIRTEDEIGRLSRSFNAMVRDLEERSDRLARSEARFRLLAESLTEILFSVDSAGRLLYINPQVERILGFRPFDLQGRNLMDVIPGRFETPQAALAASGGSEAQYEVAVEAADRRQVVLEVKLVRAEGAALGVAAYGLARDITERTVAAARLSAYQEQLRSLASRLTLTEARERKRIATEIHDRIGQALALTRIKLGLLAGEKMSEEQSRTLQETLPVLEGVIQDTRSLIFSVSSPLLYEVGLSAALERLVEQFNDGRHGEFSYVMRGRPPVLGGDVSVLLFDAVKELLVNAVKHARAKRVRVTMSAANGYLRLRVSDDGIGFDPAARDRRESGGYGLFSIAERLQFMKGSMGVRSRPGRGTCIVLEVPVPRSLRPRSEEER